MDGAGSKRNLNIKTGDTARIDRRNTLLARIEAALLADQLAIEEANAKGGADPYNSGVFKAAGETGAWNTKRPR